METFEFKLEGPIFEEGIPIHLVIKAWENFQAIIDKTYLVATESHRLSQKDREIYYLRAKEFKRGSFLTNFEIYLGGIQLALPMVGVLGPQNIWDFTKESFNFLKLICENQKKEENSKIEVIDSHNVSVQTGDIHNHFHGPIIQIAEKSLPKYQDLAHMLEKGKIESISAGNQSSPEMFLNLDDHQLFDFPKKTDDKPQVLNCEIFDFNKFRNIGKLRVSSGQVIPKGDYSFSISGSQDNVNYIYSMLEPLVKISCLIERGNSPLGIEQISHIYVLGLSS